MIAQIDIARKRFNKAATATMRAYDDAASLIGTLDYDPSSSLLQAMTEINRAADAAIDARMKAETAEDDGATVNVTGDYIRVGSITDSANIAIGKDIQQESKHEQ